jgi:hypothetical protein
VVVSSVAYAWYQSSISAKPQKKWIVWFGKRYKHVTIFQNE